MKKIIRKGVFESNSSSSHSLVVTKNTEVEDLSGKWWLTKDGELSLYDSDIEFDRSPEKPLISFYDKLRYAVASYANNEQKIKEIVELAKELIPGCTGINFPERAIYNWETDEYERDGSPYYGYVDHQSAGILHKYLTKHNVSIKEFLTNKKYIIILDGDEYCMWEAMKESGLINKDYIEDEVGIYEKDY